MLISPFGSVVAYVTVELSELLAYAVYSLFLKGKLTTFLLLVQSEGDRFSGTLFSTDNVGGKFPILPLIR